MVRQRSKGEAAEFYASIFPNSKITNVTTIHDTPSGDCDVVSFELSRSAVYGHKCGTSFQVQRVHLIYGIL